MSYAAFLRSKQQGSEAPPPVAGDGSTSGAATAVRPPPPPAANALLLPPPQRSKPAPRPWLAQAAPRAGSTGGIRPQLEPNPEPEVFQRQYQQHAVVLGSPQQQAIAAGGAAGVGGSPWGSSSFAASTPSPSRLLANHPDLMISVRPAPPCTPPCVANV